MNGLDLRVYVITSDVPELGRRHEQVVAEAIAGGATIIQFRDKTMSNRQFAETARRLVTMSRISSVPFIVNDRVEIAIEVGADGVHIGRNDGDPRTIRELLPPGMILGISAIDYADALSLDTTGADYLGVGPIFPTISKDDATLAIGAEKLARICRDVSKPAVAIGGIKESNLKSVIDAGAAGSAVISAVTHALDMPAAVARLRNIWEEPGRIGRTTRTYC